MNKPKIKQKHRWMDIQTSFKNNYNSIQNIRKCHHNWTNNISRKNFWVSLVCVIYFVNWIKKHKRCAYEKQTKKFSINTYLKLGPAYNIFPQNPAWERGGGRKNNCVIYLKNNLASQIFRFGTVCSIFCLWEYNFLVHCAGGVGKVFKIVF